MFCPKCGKEVGVGERFCGACGELLTETKENNITRKPDSNGKSRPSIIVWSIVAVLLLIVTGEVIALLRQRAEAAEREEMREDRQRREEETQEERQRREEETQIQAQMDVNDSAHGFKENVGQDNVVTQSEEGVDDETDFGEESTPPEEVTWTWIEYNPPEGDAQIMPEGNEEDDDLSSSVYETYGFLEQNDAGYVLFGRYEQDNNTVNGPEPIEWEILDVNENGALLISRYVLDQRPYNAEKGQITWEECTLRKWMNNEFLNTAFTIEEQTKISTATLPRSYNPLGSPAGTHETQDKVFLLSEEEILKYYNFDDWKDYRPSNQTWDSGAYGYSKELITPATPYVYAQERKEWVEAEDWYWADWAESHDDEVFYHLNCIVIESEEQIQQIQCDNRLVYGSEVVGMGGVEWFTRSPGGRFDMVCYVDWFGGTGWGLDHGAKFADKVAGVRPAIWISVE